MDGYSVKILPSAQIDIMDIVKHINTQPPEAAVQSYDKLIERIGTLIKSPEQFPSAKDTQLRLRGYRTLPVNDHIAFFVIKGKTVELRRVLYSKRQFDRLFQER